MIKNQSPWIQDIQIEQFSHLTKDISVDIAIIGGGIAGITTAYFLSKTGKKVILIEKGDLTKSTTAYTTAFLTYEIDTDITDLIKSIGRKETQKVWESHRDAIDSIEKISKEEKIDCDFTRCDEFITATNKKEKEEIEEMSKAAKEIGFDLSIQTTNLPSFSSHGMLIIPHQAKFHPIKYCNSLIKKVAENGVLVINNTEVTRLTKGTPNILTTKRGVITADHVVISTYDPFNHPLELFAHKGMYTSYVF